MTETLQFCKIVQQTKITMKKTTLITIYPKDLNNMI